MAKKKNIFKSKKAQNGESPVADSLLAKPSESGVEPAQAPPPLFYKDPHPIHAVRHGARV